MADMTRLSRTARRRGTKGNAERDARKLSYERTFRNGARLEKTK